DAAEVGDTWADLSFGQKNAVALKLGYTQEFASNSGEYVGRYKDESDVDYTQTTSDFISTDPWGGGYNEPHSLVDDGAARWRVDYTNNSGDRFFDMEDRSSIVSKVRDPNWEWKGTAKANYTDAFNNGRYTQNINSRADYNSVLNFETASLTQTDDVSRSGQVDYTFKYWSGWTNQAGYWIDDDDGSTFASGYGDEEDFISREHGLRNLTAFDYATFGLIGYGDSHDQFYGSGQVSHSRLDAWGWNPGANTFDVGWQVQTEMDYRTGSEAEGGSGDDLRLIARNRYEIGKTINKTWHDYDYHWISTWNPIYDTRIKLSYQLSTQSQDIFDYRAIYETTTKEVKVVNFDTQTVWEKQEITDTQTRTWTEREIKDGVAKTYGEFSGESISAKNINIESVNSITLSGLVLATETMTIDTDKNFTIDGALTSGADLKSTSKITFGNTLTINAANTLSVDDTAHLVGTGASSDILLNADVSLVLGGEITSLDTVIAKSAQNITLSGKITTGNLINISAG
ncbi:hypothetical protein MJH12_13790, partial [bacterium]|nr:hypothetical protein [bacterium]